MAENVEKQPEIKLRAKKFAFQLDESTLRDNEAILLAYVRFLDDNGLKEEILLPVVLKQTLKAKQFSKKLSLFKGKYSTQKYNGLC